MLDYSVGVKAMDTGVSWILLDSPVVVWGISFGAWLLGAVRS